METDLFRYPTSAEMRALEIAARRARAQELARLFGVAAQGMKSLVVRLVAALAGKEISHA